MSGCTSGDELREACILTARVARGFVKSRRAFGTQDARNSSTVLDFCVIDADTKLYQFGRFVRLSLRLTFLRAGSF